MKDVPIMLGNGPFDMDEPESSAPQTLTDIFAKAMTQYFDLMNGPPMVGKPYIDSKKRIQAEAAAAILAELEQLIVSMPECGFGVPKVGTEEHTKGIFTKLISEAELRQAVRDWSGK